MPTVSVIITSFNEGGDVQATIDSVRASTTDVEVVLVDDGSTDGSCADAGADVVIQHSERVGIAVSRRDGVAAAKGDAFCFLDAHQYLTQGCINQCTSLALERQAIVCPCTRGPVDRVQRNDTIWTGHGSIMSQQPNGLYVGRWRNRQPRDTISRCSMMVVPGYVIPRSVYPQVEWLPQLKQWGGSEPCITVRAFFADVDILHLCGPIARHLFRGKKEDGSIDRPFSCPFSVTWRNHAHTSRLCFDDDTWDRYWWPEIYRKWAQPEEEAEFQTPEVVQQHRQFLSYKQRPDDEFWRGLMGIRLPDVLRRRAEVRRAG
jgi:glycosyltransferase involved in cell wall biosynthesis